MTCRRQDPRLDIGSCEQQLLESDTLLCTTIICDQRVHELLLAEREEHDGQTDRQTERESRRISNQVLPAQNVVYEKIAICSLVRLTHR